MKLSRFIVIISIFFSLLWADWDTRWCNANQWRLGISNFGKIGQSPYGTEGGFWPGGTDHNYIYGAGIWIGGILPNGDTVVAAGYMPHNGTSEFAPGLPYSDPYGPEWRVYFSTDSNYPLPVLSFLDSYCTYNEFDTTYHATDSFHVKEPLGITVNRKTYVWPSSWYDDVVFVEYVITNDTTYSLGDIYAGIGMDFDIGNEAGTQANDMTGFDLSRKLGFGYQIGPEPGWDWVGKFGLKILSGYTVAAFKRFTLENDPRQDRERYLMLAGYDFTTGIYEPYDSLAPEPADQRFVLSVGPFDLQPDDSLLLDYVIIGARDTLLFDTTDLKYKADAAQIFYNNYHLYGSHEVSVNYPNGGEVLTGNVTVTYDAASSTGNPLAINVLHSSDAGMSWTTIDSLLVNTGTYNWNSANYPDGVLHKIGIFAFDTLVIGCDASDGIFTIDNPGNTPPTLVILTPPESDTLSGNCDITWFARDPEFGDSLLIDIYFMSQYDTAFLTIALDEPNDSVYTWNTVPHRNGSGTLVIQTHDEEFTVAETLDVFLLNLISSGTMDHIYGINNVVDLSVLVHDAQQITGHTYELEFLEYRALLQASSYYPEYIYEIRDSNTGVTVLDTHSLKGGYEYSYDGINISDFSPITDGFSIWTRTENASVASLLNFVNDSVSVVLGSYPEDSILLWGPVGRTWWAYRGACLQLDWATHPSGGLTLLVTDLDYADTIPYKPYNRFGLNSDSAFGWCFTPLLPTAPPSDTLRPGYDRLIMLCGEVIRIAATVFPQVGDRWVVYPSEYSPPIKGNLYRFTPTGITEYKGRIAVIGFQVYPVPSIRNLTIAYNLPQRQEVALTIYDVLGRQVRVLKNGTDNPGQYKITWNGSDDRSRKVSAGVYFCRLETEDWQDTKKFVMLK